MEKAKRNIHYSFKVSPEEDAAIRQKMKSIGIRNRSTYLRAMMLNGYLLKLDMQEMHEAVRLMGKMSGNINQIARRLNEHGSIYETEIEEIVDAQRELKELLSQILQRLGYDHGLQSEKKTLQHSGGLCSHIRRTLLKRGNVMATTHIISIHVGKGKTAYQSIKDRLDYIMNPEKTDGGILISSHVCSPETAAEEFMLYRQEYLNTTGRKRKDEVLAYHVRQAFKPGEITAEKANEIGKKLAERLTDKQHAFVVATHIDKQHIHNHIILCATSLDGQQKYRDVKRSAKDLVQISDALCEENGLSVIRNPQDKAVPYDKWEGNSKKNSHRDDLRIMIDAALRHRPDGFDALLQMLEDAGCRIKCGAHISLKPPDGQRYIRLKSLGPEYDEDTLRQTLAGDHVHIPKTPRADYSKSQIKRLIDIENKLRAGKGKGYQVWAERNNIDAISQTVIFLKEHHIGSPEELEKQIDELQSAYDEKKASIRQAQNRMKEINRQRQAIRDYRRTKEIYTQFRESGWSAKFYQEHRVEIEAHKKAQAVYEHHDGKLPTLKELTAEYAALKGQLNAYKPDLAELKSKLTDLKHVRYNYRKLTQDIPQTDQYHREGDRIER